MDDDNILSNFFEADPFADLHVLPIFDNMVPDHYQKDNINNHDYIQTTLNLDQSCSSDQNKKKTIQNLTKTTSSISSPKYTKKEKVCHHCGQSPTEGSYSRSDMRFTTCPKCPKICSFKTCPIQEDYTMGAVGLLHSGFCAMHSREYTNDDRSSSWAPQHPQRKHAHPFILPTLTSKAFTALEQEMELLYIDELILQLSMLRLYDTSDTLERSQWERIHDIATKRCECRGYQKGYQEINRIPVVLSMVFILRDKTTKHINPHIDVENAYINYACTKRDEHKNIIRDNIHFTVEFLPCFIEQINSIISSFIDDIVSIEITHISLRTHAHTQRYHVPLLLCDGNGISGYGIERPEHKDDYAWSFRPFHYFRQVPVPCYLSNKVKSTKHKETFCFTMNKINEVNNVPYNPSSNQNTTSYMQLRERNILKQQFRSFAVSGHLQAKRKTRSNKKNNTEVPRQLRTKRQRLSTSSSSTSNQVTSNEIKESSTNYLPHACDIYLHFMKNNPTAFSKIEVQIETKMPVGPIGTFCKQKNNMIWNKLDKEQDVKKYIEVLHKYRQRVVKYNVADYLFSVF